MKTLRVYPSQSDDRRQDEAAFRLETQVQRVIINNRPKYLVLLVPVFRTEAVNPTVPCHPCHRTTTLPEPAAK